jgi:hypothetical protein
MSRDAFPSDPALPQLVIASDPELMREIFRRHLRPLTAKGYDIQECVLSRVRYRRPARCVLQYTLRLVEPGTGLDRSQWVSGHLYGEDRAAQISQRLRAADPGQESAKAFLTFDPVSFIPDLGMLVQVFPYDRRLPTLPFLMAGPSPDLDPVLLAQFGPGDWHTEAWTIEPVRYRAELGAVLRYRVCASDTGTGRRETRCVYVKVYRDDKGETTYPVLQALWGRAQAGEEGFTVGRPLAYLSGLRALLQEEAPGSSLQEFLLQGHDPVSTMRNVAQALAAFNQDDLATPRRHSPEDEIHDVKRVGQFLQWACPHLRADVEAITGAIASGLEEVPPGPTHRDFKLDHVLLHGDRLALIDLDEFAEADPVLDPATLLAQLAGMRFRFTLTPDRSQRAARAFAEEYFAHVPGAWRRRLPLHYAGASLKVAAGFFRRQEPRWIETIAALVEEARRSLTGDVW